MIEYARELKRVACSFDVNKFRKFIRKHHNILPDAGRMLAKDDLFLLGVMAKMVMNMKVDEDSREKAEGILLMLGWSADIWK